MRNSALYYLQNRHLLDLPALDKLADPYGILLCGGEMNAEAVGKVVARYPGKLVGAYLILSDLSAGRVAGYPGPMAVYAGTDDPFCPYNLPGAAADLQHVGLLNAETVEWSIAEAKKALGNSGAQILMIDCYSPKNFSWKAGVSFDGSGKATTSKAVSENWSEWTVNTLGAFDSTIDAHIVPNAGHSCNPAMVPEPLRSIYLRFCCYVNGIGVEGNPMTPASWSGPFRQPGISFLFTQTKASFAAAMQRAFPPNVVPCMATWAK